jgi:phosphatidylglycerophosphate synthase
MTIYRSVVAKDGISIPARQSAKWKTFVQDFAIAFVCLPPTANLHWLHVVTVWAAAVLTITTFAQYIVDGRRLAAQ